MPNVLRITGVKNSGKTRLIEELSSEFIKRGLRVAALKTTSHDHEFDRPGTDTWRFRKAGCESAVLISPDEFVCHAKGIDIDKRNMIYDILYRDIDLLLVEGAGELEGPMIECVVSEESARFLEDPDLIAIVSEGIPIKEMSSFRYDSIPQIAEFVIIKLKIKKAGI